MASTTIRVSAETRDELNSLCAQQGKSAGALIAELVAGARSASLLAATERHWHLMVSDPQMQADYRAATDDLAAFDSELPPY
jgi:hypothetical protein